MADLKRQLDACALAGAEHDAIATRLTECEQQYNHWLTKEAELSKEEDAEKWNVDTISQEKWTTTVGG